MFKRMRGLDHRSHVNYCVKNPSPSNNSDHRKTKSFFVVFLFTQLPGFHRIINKWCMYLCFKPPSYLQHIFWNEPLDWTPSWWTKIIPHPPTLQKYKKSRLFRSKAGFPPQTFASDSEAFSPRQKNDYSSKRETPPFTHCVFAPSRESFREWVCLLYWRFVPNGRR